ncbi:MAG: hypothetical protein LLG14_16930 [Nocardiaceae bacterium]|nr:hypothetical protein [Nocardiaceae bacterium]
MDTRPVAGQAASRDGSITVRTTEQGIPTELHIDPSEMQRPPEVLARRLTDLCKQAAVRAGYERRRQLAEQGVDPTVLSYLQLPTLADVQAIEVSEDEDA